MSLSATRWRVAAALIAGAVILALLNWDIAQKERLIENGRGVLLQLAPVDPRSLMQGDYMALRFALGDDIRRAAGDGGDKIGADGKVIVKPDEHNVARFVRLDDGQHPLQPGEIRLRYRIRDRWGAVKIATNAFFFTEGQGATYAPARYGEFRVNATGDAILTQLRDEQFNVLGRSAVLD